MKNGLRNRDRISTPGVTLMRPDSERIAKRGENAWVHRDLQGGKRQPRTRGEWALSFGVAVLGIAAALYGGEYAVRLLGRFVPAYVASLACIIGAAGAIIMAGVLALTWWERRSGR